MCVCGVFFFLGMSSACNFRGKWKVEIATLAKYMGFKYFEKVFSQKLKVYVW